MSLLLVSLIINAIFIFYPTPKPKEKTNPCALYMAEFKVVDNETGEPIKLFKIRTPGTRSFFSGKSLKPFKESIVKSLTIWGVNILDGYACIVWMKDTDTPCEFHICADGYQEILLPKEIITEIKGAGGIFMHPEKQIKLKKTNPN